ncbi:FMN-binding glutamate synthase family protein [Pseudomarimonas salicorniae]|uniref:FMN-binding glutamate synthase family protein n=1 Tax=Pseudomarimonas salicorniae TaxID=2933270 RepID=A0ABT0GHM9_9GAMM|nr:FMN-binding glutamate synthase family protein [Lysobacter sp. CAU 1642]MCK7594054.1 FMN-binding glutamate synthase family protein [Lysobacter sp. CAU 1642]
MPHPRYWTWLGSGLLALLAAWLAWKWQSAGWAVAAALASLIAAIGTRDHLQRFSAVRRNYPVLAHFRFLIESIRPEIRQYLLEDEEEAMPFSRVQRSLVYQRAKNVVDKRPFGTLQDLYADRYEWINHSMQPSHIDSHDFRIDIGGPACRRPYSCSVFNISAMSFGSLSANAILALNHGARLGGFYHDTGEGSISRYHREPGGDLVWEIGSGYFGCRNAEGGFDPERFRENAALEQVRMIEIKLSQGAKPGHGGVLPATKITAEIAAARGIPMGEECVSPAAHRAFSTPRELLAFVSRLRELSGGKPVGFKLAIGHPWEWFAIAKAMQETGELPDFIVVDGGEGGTGAAPLEFTDHMGTPLVEALRLVHNTLVGLGLREHIRIGAAGKVVSAFDIVRCLALGADWCNAARGFMFALGCIQSLSCHTDKCPTGVATQDPGRMRALDVGNKAQRVFHFHHNTMKALKELLAGAGLSHPSEIGPEHIMRRVSPTEVRSLADFYPWHRGGELLGDGVRLPHFERFWNAADAGSFHAPADLIARRRAKSV